MKLPQNDAAKLVPEHTMAALERYIFNGLTPGGFLTAVLEGDLFRAVARADWENKKALADIVAYLYSSCPSGCYGDAEKVESWLDDDNRQRSSYAQLMTPPELTVVK